MTTQMALFYIGTLLLTALLGYGTFVSAKLLQDWQPDRNLMLLPAENVLRLLLVGVCYILGVVSGVPNEALGWINPAGSTWFPQSVLWGVALALLFYGSTRWLIQWTGKRYYSSVVIEAIVPRDASETIPVLFAMLPAVIVEELLFRSLLIGGFGEILPIWVLLIGTGILFGVMHSPQGIWGMCGAGLAGRSLWGAISVVWLDLDPDCGALCDERFADRDRNKAAGRGGWGNVRDRIRDRFGWRAWDQNGDTAGGRAGIVRQRGQFKTASISAMTWRLLL